MNGKYSPKWVQSVTQEQIIDQRLDGWPDFHPEDFCHRCGQRNPVWFTDRDVWIKARGGRLNIVCPSCFASVHDEDTRTDNVWYFVPQYRLNELKDAAEQGSTARGMLTELMIELLDPDPCVYDHHDLCQTHNLHSKPCPNETGQSLLKELNENF